MATVILHQFPSSHYNEKARWALTYKHVDHTRQSYLPGPHISQIKKLSGQSSVPVLEWDGAIVPAVRTIAWAGMINHNRYATSVFGKGKPRFTMFFYRLAFPFVKPLIAKANGVNPENIEKSKLIVQSYLDEINEAVSNTGYLISAQFSAADLTAAALLAPLANPDHEDMKRPSPIVDSFKEILDTYSRHPTISWVEKQYREQRS